MRWGPLPALALAAACGSADPPELPPVITSENITLVKAVSYPGGATRLTVRLHQGDGGAPADLGGQLGLRIAGGAPPQLELQPAPLEPGHTLVVFCPPGDPDQRAAAAAGVAELVAARPAGERIALYWFEETLLQLRNFDDDHAELAAAAALLATRPASGGSADLAAMARSAGALVSTVGGEHDDRMRAVLVAGCVAPPEVPLTPPIQWVGSGIAALDVDGAGAGRVVRIEDHGGDWSLALAAAAARLDEAAASAHHDIAVCADPAGEPAVISLDAERELAIELPPSLPEEVDLPCDAAAALARQRIWPERIDFLFTADQRAVYEQRVAGENRSNFELSVRLGGDRQPIKATAHLRGKGSIGCERKSYTLDLEGPRPRYTMPGSATDEFHLLSLCLDDRYVHQYTVLSLWRQLGMFPLEFRLVELALDGETRGLYLLVEQVADELRLDNGGVESVLRRGYSPPDTSIEIKYARAGDAAAAASYAESIDGIAGLSGEPLLAALETRIDLDQYLEWLASNAALRNGDYVDEVWMVGLHHMNEAGTVAERYRFAGWDPEDTFAVCHYENRYAFADPWQITYCAEAEWDFALLADTIGFARYADVLERLLTERLTDEVFAQLLDATEAAMTPWLARPEIAGAMVELLALNPAAADPAVALGEIRAELDAMASEFGSRRADLLAGIAAYRAQ